MAAPKKKPAPRRHLWIGALVVGIVVAAPLLVVGAAQAMSGGRPLPGVKVAGLSAATSPDVLEKALRERVDEINEKGFDFQFDDKRVAVMPTVSATADLDLTYDLVTFDVDATLADAQNYGRTGSWLTRIGQTLAAVIGQAQLPLHYTLDDERFTSVLKDNFGQFDKPTVDTSFVDAGGSVGVRTGKQGTVLNYDAGIAALRSSLDLGKVPPAFTLSSVSDITPATEAEAQEFLAKVEDVLAAAPATLTVRDKTYTVGRNELLSWLTLNANRSGRKLALDAETVKEKLAAIAAEVNVTPQEGKFAIENGKVKEFQVGTTGWELDQAASAAELSKELLKGENTVALVGNEVEPQTTTAETGDLGITELIGTGKSNFAGSPVNRRHNIAVGAAAVNGSLIKDGEEFSLIKTLGKIEASTGYRTELVIKGNKTIPEYGGGLCQIGTTTFRAALASGLPITERRNHSYRVRYYEPAGTDATIYDPKPDFRFMNDTGHAVLIQTRIDGDELIFEFWGTSDGRIAKQSTPKVTNIVVPPPTKIIETTDLKPGEKKCTESAHNGADASFTYTVTMPDGEVKTQVFKSRYKPWQAVCLLGVKKETAPVEEEEEEKEEVPIENINVNDSV
jgi:vancomycin resistance protein YoaR